MTVQITEAMWRTLKARAAIEGLTVSEYVRGTFENWIASDPLTQEVVKIIEKTKDTP
jgi:hypothetical protein